MTRIKKLLTNYAGVKRVDEISPFGHSVVVATSASTYIEEGTELIASLKSALTELDDFTNSHAQLTPLLTAELNALRQAVLNQLSKVANTLNNKYAGNEMALLSSGLELAADPTPTQPPGAPAFCEIVDGKQSGTMLVRIKRVPGSVNVLWYTTTDPSLPLAEWRCTLCNADEVAISGLVPGTRLYAKAACINGASTTDNLALAEAKPRYVE